MDERRAPAFLLALLAIARVALVLHSNPQLVHLGEVEVDEVDRVLHGARFRTGAKNTKQTELKQFDESTHS